MKKGGRLATVIFDVLLGSFRKALCLQFHTARARGFRHFHLGRNEGRRAGGKDEQAEGTN